MNNGQLGLKGMEIAKPSNYKVQFWFGIINKQFKTRQNQIKTSRVLAGNLKLFTFYDIEKIDLFIDLFFFDKMWQNILKIY